MSHSVVTGGYASDQQPKEGGLLEQPSDECINFVFDEVM